MRTPYELFTCLVISLPIIRLIGHHLRLGPGPLAKMPQVHGKRVERSGKPSPPMEFYAGKRATLFALYIGGNPWPGHR